MGVGGFMIVSSVVRRKIFYVVHILFLCIVFSDNDHEMLKYFIIGLMILRLLLYLLHKEVQKNNKFVLFAHIQ